MSGDQDWRKYEQQIHDRLKTMAGADAVIKFDVKLPGRFSGTERQVDVYVEGTFANIAAATMSVDCKCFSRKVDVKGVETVMGLVEDVGTDFGLLVTTEGFTDAAKQRAKSARGMQLDVVPFEKLAEWEPDVAICGICSDEDAPPGIIYIDAFDLESMPEGGELGIGAGFCDRCNAIHVKCACGTVNEAYDAQSGDWIECEGGCGTLWCFDQQLDRKGMPETDDAREMVSFRAGP